MKRILLAGLGLFALAAQPVLAADRALPYKAPPPPAIFNWSGFYIGGDAGYVWGRARLNDIDGYNGAGANFSYRPDGFQGGGHAGFNWQANALVAGLEVEFGYMGLNGSRQFPPYVGVRTPFDSRAYTDGGWYAAFTGRLGIAANNWLFYGKGGYVTTGIHNRFIDPDPIGTVLVSGTTSGNRDGWTGGGGIEYAFNYNWSMRLEYAHYDFGTIRHTALNQFGVPFRFDHPLTADSVRIGFSYRFGGPLL